MKKLFIVILLLITTTVGVYAYSGTLTYSDDLTALMKWAVEDETSFTYNVNWDSINNWWDYEYTLTVADDPGISHLIIEISDNFTIDDIIADSAYGPFEDLVIDDYGPTNPSNPSIPGTMYGLKFDETDGKSITVGFSSYRIPVWGDFYAKGGSGTNANSGMVWNNGFTAVDFDPSDPYYSTAITDHILVPDTQTNVVPEFPVYLSGIIGMALVAIRSKLKI